MVSMKKCVIAGVFLALLAALPITPVSSQTATPRTQQLQRQFVPGRLLVKFNSRTAPTHARQIIAALGARDANEIPGAGVHIVELPYQASENAFAKAFAARAEVEFAELDWLLTPQQTLPNDPLFPSWYLERIDAPNAWLTTTGNSSVTIAILDTGASTQHIRI